MNYEVTCLPMKKTNKTNDLLNEELYSRIEIQERSLQSYAKEIFENIGQVLSLVKLQILGLQVEDTNIPGKISDSGKLLGKAIADLRNLTKQLSPDEIIKHGFAQAITCELKRLSNAGFCDAQFSVKGDYIKLKSVKELVVFCVLQQLIYPVLNLYESGLIKLSIRYHEDKIAIEIKREFKGEPLLLDIEEMVNFKQRLKTIDGSIRYKNRDWHILQLVINY